MRKLVVSTFVSLDGVMQAPGGPEEDPTGGFAFGGWMAPLAAEDLDFAEAGFDARGRALLLGRRTYQIFEAYWPYQAADDPTAQSLNAATKYVASRTLSELHWRNSQLLTGAVADAVAALKATPGPDLQVIGSRDLVRTLQAAALVDEFHVWTFPVVLGRGKRLFDEGARPTTLRLAHARVSAGGVVMSTYVPAGDVAVGSFPGAQTSDLEFARRRRMADGTW